MTTTYTRNMVTLERGKPLLTPPPGRNLTFRSALQLLGVIVAGRARKTDASMSATLLCKDGQITIDLPYPKDKPVDELLDWLDAQVLALRAQKELDR